MSSTVPASDVDHGTLRGASVASLADIRRLAELSGQENFPVALRVLPRARQAELGAVYGVARLVDDIGDAAEGDRLALLDAFEADLDRVWGDGRPQLAALARLVPVVRAHRLSPEPLHRLVAANRQDQTVGRYADWDSLVGYCRLSADPVGRIVLGLAEADTDHRVVMSDQVCTALQVLEHCQDVGEDARAGRVYLPQADLDREHVTDDDLVAASASPQLRRVVAVEVDRADALLAAGPPLVRSLHGWARVAVAGFVAGGLATAAALRDADHDVLATAVRPSKPLTLRLAARLWAVRS